MGGSVSRAVGFLSAGDFQMRRAPGALNSPQGGAGGYNREP